MHDVDEGKAVLDFRVGCHRHQPRSLHCPRNCSLSLSLSLSFSLSLSLSDANTHTRTHDGTIAAAHFFFQVLFRTYRGACLTFVWHFLFIVTRIEAVFFFFRLEFAAFLCVILEQNSFPIKGQRQSLFTSVKGLSIKVKKHARTHTPKAAKLSTCSPQQAGVRNYSSVELSFLYRGITSKKKPRNQKYRPSALDLDD